MTSPLVPKACDLTDFPHMAVDVRRLLNSETWILGSDTEKAASMTLWLESWHQIPSGSIPANDKMLAHLSGAGSKWTKAKEHVLRGWILCDDGRYYHPVVSEKALEAWIEKLYAAISGNNGNTKRWGIVIDNTELEARLRDAVIRLKELAPRSKALNKKIVKIVEAQSQGNSQSESGGDSGGDRNREGEREGEGYREDNINKKGEGAFLTAEQAKALWVPVLANLNSLLIERSQPEATQAELDSQIADFNRNNHGKGHAENQLYLHLRTWILKARSVAHAQLQANVQKQAKPSKPPQPNYSQRTTDTSKSKERGFDDYLDGQIYSGTFTAGDIRKAMQAGESPDYCVARLVREKFEQEASQLKQEYEAREAAKREEQQRKQQVIDEFEAKQAKAGESCE